MLHVDVHGEVYFVSGPKALLNLIEEKMGRDTRKALERFIDEAAEILGAGKRLSEKDKCACDHLRGAL